uniref:Immunoglobulin V-set domain-containing protein n=1 Tax=Pundamilia nyererei TaxID=303518 RepID=A0A3B4FC57_9CICH
MYLLQHVEYKISYLYSLFFSFLMLFTFLTDRCCDTVTKVQSYEGYSESISCPYDSQYQNNFKYICRGNRPSTCLQQALITSNNRENRRFRLDDEKMLRKFTVAISNLTQSDSGSYLCGVQRNSDLDVFSAHTSTVPSTMEIPGKTTTHNKTTTQNRPNKGTVYTMCLLVCAVLLISYVR